MTTRTKSTKAARTGFSMKFEDGYLSASVNLTAKQVAFLVSALVTSPFAVEALKSLLNVR